MAFPPRNTPSIMQVINDIACVPLADCSASGSQLLFSHRSGCSLHSTNRSDCLQVLACDQMLSSKASVAVEGHAIS
jgi:hypothetical protein